MTIRFYRAILSFIIIGVWSSAIFEIGFTYFIEKLGFSLFRLFGALLICSSVFYILVIRKGKLPGRLFFRNHKVLIFLYIAYWLIAWFGILYSSNADIGLLISLQYFWYTLLALLTIFVLFDFSVEKRMLLFFLTGLLSLLIMSYFSTTAFISGVPVSVLAEQKGRFSLSLFHDYNVFTYSLLLGILLIFIYAKNNYSNVSVQKLFFYVALIVGVMILGVTSGSRRTIMIYCPVAVITPFFLLGLRSLGRFVKSIVFSATIFILLTISALYWINPEAVTDTTLERLGSRGYVDIVKRINRGLGFITGYYDDTARIIRWERAWHLAGEYSLGELLIGRGTRSYFAEPDFIRPDGSRDSPHNFLLSALLEGGVLKLFVLVLFVTVWLYHLLLICRDSSFWLANFLIVSNILWIISALISGSEFFYSKQFLLIFIVYAVFWNDVEQRNLVENSTPSIEFSKVSGKTHSIKGPISSNSLLT